MGRLWNYDRREIWNGQIPLAKTLNLLDHPMSQPVAIYRHLERVSLPRYRKRTYQKENHPHLEPALHCQEKTPTPKISGYCIAEGTVPVVSVQRNLDERKEEHDECMKNQSEIRIPFKLHPKKKG